MLYASESVNSSHRADAVFKVHWSCKEKVFFRGAGKLVSNIKRKKER